MVCPDHVSMPVSYSSFWIHSFSLCVIESQLCSFPAGLDDNKRLLGFYSSSVAKTFHGPCQPSQPAHNVAVCLEIVIPPQQGQISFLYITPFLQYTVTQQSNGSLTDYQLIRTSVGSFHFPNSDSRRHFSGLMLLCFIPSKALPYVVYVMFNMLSLLWRFMTPGIIAFFVQRGPTET